MERIVPADIAFSEVITYARYFRRVDGNRPLFGILTVLDSVAPDDLRRVIGVRLRDTFPQLGDVRLEFAWPGVFATTRDTTP